MMLAHRFLSDANDTRDLGPVIQSSLNLYILRELYEKRYTSLTG